MYDPLFDPDKCDVPAVPRLDFDFVSECSIPAPPPPIFDCMPPMVPRDPPPPLCPQFETNSAVTLAVKSENCITQAAEAAIAITNVETDPCKFVLDFDLDLSIPIPTPPCPTITGGEVNVTAAFADCLQASSAINVTTEITPASCDNDQECKYTIDLDLAIPIPPIPCPEITATGSIAINEALSAPSIAFQVTPTVTEVPCEPPQCKFDFDLDIEIPPFCPEITVSGVIDSQSGLAKPTMVFTVEKDPEACKFDFDIDILIPELCPEITVSGVIDSQSGLAKPTMVFTVEKDPETCAFDFDIDILIPELCPEITATGTVIVTPGRDDPTLVFTVQKNEPCNFDFDLTLEMPPPRPCPEFTGVVTIYPTSQPTGVIEFLLTEPTAPDEPCIFDVNLDLGIPICIPEFEVTQSIFCTPGRNEPSMVFSITGPGPSDCKYQASLDIELPCSRPCPAITGVVTVYEASQPTGVLTVNHEPPESDTEQCVYELDLQIGVRAGNKLEKGTVTAAWTICTATPTCDVTVDPPDVDGIQKIHIDVRVPQPPEYIGGTINLGDFGSGTITIDASDPCNRTINANIELTTTGCSNTNSES